MCNGSGCRGGFSACRNAAVKNAGLFVFGEACVARATAFGSTSDEP